MNKQINMKQECEAVIANDLMDSMIFYLQEFPERRDEFCKELTDAFTQTLQQLRKDFEEEEEED